MKPTVEWEKYYEANSGFEVHYEANNYGHYRKINNNGTMIKSGYEPERT